MMKMKTIEKIIIITLILIIIAWGIILYKQWQDIYNLKKSNEDIVNTQKSNIINNKLKTNNINKSNEKGIKIDIKKEIFNQAKETENELVKNTKNITWIIKSFSGNYFEIESSIIDVSKLKNLDYTSSVSLPNIKKTFKVNINNNTKFINIKKNDLKIWGIIDVESNDTIYKTDNINAIRIVNRMVGGSFKKINFK